MIGKMVEIMKDLYDKKIFEDICDRWIERINKVYRLIYFNTRFWKITNPKELFEEIRNTKIPLKDAII